MLRSFRFLILGFFALLLLVHVLGSTELIPGGAARIIRWCMWIALVLAFPIRRLLQARLMRRRSGAWLDQADRMSLEFTDGDESFVARAPPFQVLCAGEARGAFNLLRGTIDGARVEICDFSARRISREEHDPLAQGESRDAPGMATLVLLRHPHLALPVTSLRPRSFLHVAAGRKHPHDVDFPGAAAFAATVHVEAEVPVLARALYQGEVQDWILRGQGRLLFIETRGDALVVHRGHPIPPEEAPGLLHRALHLLSQWRKAPPSPFDPALRSPDLRIWEPDEPT